MVKPLVECVKRKCGCAEESEVVVVYMCSVCHNTFKTPKVLKQHQDNVHHMRPHVGCDSDISHIRKEGQLFFAPNRQRTRTREWPHSAIPRRKERNCQRRMRRHLSNLSAIYKLVIS